VLGEYLHSFLRMYDITSVLSEHELNDIEHCVAAY